MNGYEIIRHNPILTVDGDGCWDYHCPKCYQPFHPAIAGRGRPSPPSPKMLFCSDGKREWFSVTCGRCGYYTADASAETEPVYGRIKPDPPPPATPEIPWSERVVTDSISVEAALFGSVVFVFGVWIMFAFGR